MMADILPTIAVILQMIAVSRKVEVGISGNWYNTRIRNDLMLCRPHFMG